MVLETSDLGPILEFLTSCQCCHRCMLRYLDETNYKTYSDITSVLQKLEKLKCPSTPPKRIKLEADSTNCSVCLGILAECCSQDNLKKVVEAVKNSKFEFENFAFQISLPASLLVREHLFLMHLKEKFPSNFKKDWSPPSVKEVFKWVAGPFLFKHLGSDFLPSSPFQISVEFAHGSVANDCHPLLQECPEIFLKNNSSKEVYPRQAVQKCLTTLSSEKLLSLFPLPLTEPTSLCVLKSINCSHSPIYIGGRYNKYSRELCQTPWLINGEKMRETSVQELIVEILKDFLPHDKAVFSSSGREDVDVRMLGSGRPFLLEIINPRVTHPDLEKIEKAINESTKDIAVHNLSLVSKKHVDQLKVGEEAKKKSYSALCLISREVEQGDIDHLNSLTELVIEQATPIRVLHRRPLITRPRTIYSMKAEKLSTNKLQLQLVTQAGTYIKEFVHGDFGRTVPNLASLLKVDVADILELDVDEIDLEWPPKS